MKKSLCAVVLAMVMTLISSAEPVYVCNAADFYYQEDYSTTDGNSLITVEYHTQEEIRAFVGNSLEWDQEVSYAENPNVSALPYSAGRLSDETLQSALNLTNKIRYIAGLAYDVKLNDYYNKIAQTGALMNYLNDELDHNPKKPSGVSDDLYNLGYEGCSHSNLGCGYSSLNNDIGGWMDDSDNTNIDRVGHRRWMLYPMLREIGFGAVGNYYATSVIPIDFNRNDEVYNRTGVMWPARNMPIELFGGEQAWSFSTGQYLDNSQISVRLTRERDGEVWKFSSAESNDFYVNNDGYGQTGCIIFRPQNYENITYHDGDVYDVQISGLKTGTVSYQVHFFSLNLKDAANEADNPKSNTETQETNPKDTGSSDGETKSTSESSKPVRKTIGKIKYEILDQNTVSVWKYLGSEDSVTIPATVTIKGKVYKVVSIAHRAFVRKNELKKVVIGANVENVETEAFYCCENLKRVSIGKSVKIIDAWSFAGCAALEKVVMGAKVEEIGDRAFSGCRNLKAFQIVKNTKRVGEYAFAGAKKLKKITVYSSKLTKNGVKNALSRSVIKTIQLKGNAVKKYSKYKKYFDESNAGRTAKVTKG